VSRPRTQCSQPGLEPRLLEIAMKYKNKKTGSLHRLLITFKMDNKLILIGTGTLLLY